MPGQDHRFVVTVRGPGDEDRVQYEQEFRCADFPDAKERATANARKIAKLFADCTTRLAEYPVPWDSHGALVISP